MNCKKCIHYDMCTVGKIEFKAENFSCEYFKDSSQFVELPVIAMVEQTLINGEFAKRKSEQKFIGRYAVIYFDKSKWGSPLIDICGDKPYNREQAEERAKELRGAVTNE